MTNIYEGDPKLYLTEEGAEMNFPDNSGQPEMEQGVENAAVISLFTEKGWSGNFYADKEDERIGGDYEKNSNLPVTLSNLELLRQTTISVLNDPIFGTVTSEITAPLSNQRQNLINIKPPGQNKQEILLNANGINWIFQALTGVG